MGLVKTVGSVLHFWSSFLLTHQGKKQKIGQVLRYLPLMSGTWKKHQAPGLHLSPPLVIWRVTQQKKISVSSCLTLPCKYINKSLKKMLLLLTGKNLFEQRKTVQAKDRMENSANLLTQMKLLCFASVLLLLHLFSYPFGKSLPASLFVKDHAKQPVWIQG